MRDQDVRHVGLETRNQSILAIQDRLDARQQYLRDILKTFILVFLAGKQPASYNPRQDANLHQAMACFDLEHIRAASNVDVFHL